VWLSNARTEKKTLSIIGVSFEHDLSEGTVPVVTTKKLAWKVVISAHDFILISHNTINNTKPSKNASYNCDG
jgi:thymidylate synthase